MDIATDSTVELPDCAFIELHARLLFDPRLELWISGLLVPDEAGDCIGLQSQGIQHHGIVAFADSRIARTQGAALFQ